MQYLSKQTQQKGYGQAHQATVVYSFLLSVQSTTVQAPTGLSPEFCYE